MLRGPWPGSVKDFEAFFLYQGSLLVKDIIHPLPRSWPRQSTTSVCLVTWADHGGEDISAEARGPRHLDAGHRGGHRDARREPVLAHLVEGGSPERDRPPGGEPVPHRAERDPGRGPDPGGAPAQGHAGPRGGGGVERGCGVGVPSRVEVADGGGKRGGPTAPA